MEDVIKELYEILNDRCIPDCEIFIEETNKINQKLHELDKKDPSSYEEWIKSHHRFSDIIDLITNYIGFRDAVVKVKGNIEYDKTN